MPSVTIRFCKLRVWINIIYIDPNTIRCLFMLAVFRILLHSYIADPFFPGQLMIPTCLLPTLASLGCTSPSTPGANLLSLSDLF